MKLRNILFPAVFVFLFVLLFIFYFIFSVDIDNDSINNKEVVIYFADSMSPPHYKIIEKFNKKYKGKIKVKIVDLPFEKFSTNERKEILTRSLRNKSDRLDVFTIDQIWVNRFAKWSEDMYNHFNESDLKKFIPEAIKTCYTDTLLTAIPFYIDIASMFYDANRIKSIITDESDIKKLEKQITWSDFIELKEKYKIENPFYLFQGDAYEGLICSFWESYINLCNEKCEENPLNIDNQFSLNAIKHLKDLIYNYKASPLETTNMREYNSEEYYFANEALFIRGWPTFFYSLSKIAHEKGIEVDLKQVPLPAFYPEKPSAVFGGWNLVVSKYSKNKKESIVFIKYLLSEESQKTLYDLGYILPILNSVYDDSEYILNHPIIGVYKEQFKKGIYRPMTKDYTRISDIISYYINLALKNKISEIEALKKINKMIIGNEILIR